MLIKQTLVIIDSELAARHFCSRYKEQDCKNGNFTVIALYPNIKTYLEHKGYTCKDTQHYLSEDGRTRASCKSLQITEYIRQNFDFADNLKVTDGYMENLVWYSRWSYNYIIQLIEIITTALTIHGPTKVILFDYGKARYESSPYPMVQDMYITDICQHYCLHRNIDVVFEKIKFPINFKFMLKLAARKGRALATANSITAHIHLRRIKKYLRMHPVLFTTDQYRLNTVAHNIKSEQIAVVKIQDWPDTPRLGNLFKHTSRKSPFLPNIQIHAIETLSKYDEHSSLCLENSLEQLLKDMLSDHQVFDYYGFELVQPITDKIRFGILPIILDLHKRVSALHTILKAIQPAMVFSNGCRTDDVVMGELCKYLNIPAMIISHGSHVPTYNDESGHEWYEHGRRLINAPYQYTALQSPLALEFRKSFPSNSQSISTGPLTWATPTSQDRSLQLKLAMLGEDSQDKVIVHAGTSKGSDGVRFHVYETPDEYLQSIIDVSEAVNNIANARLIVVFRPSPEISTDTLLYNLSGHTRTLVSTDNPLIDILGFTDLLVSFSSTVIEEALQNYTSVILYGGKGRYKHINCPDFSIDKNLEQDCPIYHVLNKQHLAPAIEECLHREIPIDRKSEIFSPYIFNQNDIIPINQILSETLDSSI